MAVRFYLVPKIGDGLTLSTAFRPKYIADTAGVAWSALDYGRFEPTCLVGADVTPAQHTALAGQSDVTVIPQNLDAQVGANLAAVQAALDNLKIPSDWVVGTHTYRDILRITLKVFRFVQRFTGRQLVNFFAGGVTLNTTFNALTQGQKTALQDTADSFGLDMSSVTGTTTMRQALRLVAQQLPASVCMGETF